MDVTGGRLHDPRRVGEPFSRECGCGRAFTRAEWEALPRLRDWTIDGRVFELRACACGSTMADRPLQTAADAPADE